MEIDFDEINYVTEPTWREIHADYEQFILSLTGPTVIDISGIDNTKCRVFVTLLQGNEPSGVIAMHRYLEQQNKVIPQTKIRFIICSVEAACSRPLFTKRYLDEGVDINRCFNHGDDYKAIIDKLDVDSKLIITQKTKVNYQKRASLIEKAIREVSPEMIIDLHNSNTSGPAFTITSLVNTNTLSIASFFSSTLILSDLQIGSMMEKNFHCPFVTIECGNSKDEQAHEVAYAGIKKAICCKRIDFIHQERPVEVIYRPLRLKLNQAINLSYAEYDKGNKGVTLKSHIECFNFGSAHQDEMLGWVDGNGLKNLKLMDKNGLNVLHEYFYIRENQLVCRCDLRLFKATRNKANAMNDCLFYIVKTDKNAINTL